MSRVEPWVGERDDGVPCTLYLIVHEDGTVIFTYEAVTMLLRRSGFEPRTDDGA